MAKYLLMICVCFGTLIAAGVANGQDHASRTELKRTDLADAPGMEVISATAEYQPGEEVPRHFHHGVEMAYVLQGTLIQTPGKDPVMLATGTPLMFLRDVPHAGFRIVGDKSLKLFIVHIVDKGKPLYEPVK